uniref:UPF0020 domain-containing protein n=1 Tax=Haemonchus placei TaxID=6290 RepID=A0A158QLF5_HAEPC
LRIILHRQFRLSTRKQYRKNVIVNNELSSKCSFAHVVLIFLQMLVMASLNRESLFKRNVCSFGPTTMRSTMCYCLVALAQPKPGDVVLDPMCGGGSIPLEGALAFPGCLFFGADHHSEAISRCSRNLLSQCGSVVAFIACDAVNLPFSESSIDAVVTDLPYGKKIGSVGDNLVLYPRLLVEWARVVKPNGRLVIMTHDKRSYGFNSTCFLVPRGQFRTANKIVICLAIISCTLDIHIGRCRKCSEKLIIDLSSL